VNKRFLISIVLVVAWALPSFSQQSGSETGPLTIEQLFLQISPEIKLIRVQAFTEDRDTKLDALEDIQSMINEGRLSAEAPGAPEAHFILDYLASEGMTRTVRESSRLINYYPEVRRRAVNLLGKLGGAGATDSLIQALVTDIEPMVLAEAAYALGTIGENTDNQTSQALARVVLSQDVVAPDNNLAFASLLAFEKIAESNGGLNDALAFHAIIRIAQGNYIRSVRLKAIEVIDVLRSY